MREFILMIFILFISFSCNEVQQQSEKSISDSSISITATDTIKNVTTTSTLSNLPEMLAGQEMKATGNEPFWFLELKKDSLHFKLISGFEFTEPLPAPVFNKKDSTKYFMHTQNAAFTVLIEKKECTDGMSGFKSPFSVTATFTGEDNTQMYKGCGDYATAFDKPRENPE